MEHLDIQIYVRISNRISIGFNICISVQLTLAYKIKFKLESSLTLYMHVPRWAMVLRFQSFN